MENLNKHFENISEFSLWGAGEQAQSFIKLVSKDFNILNIYDNDENKSNTTFNGIKILHSSILKKQSSKVKILITTHYHDIKDQLIEMGLKEDEDFFEINKFVSLWYWYNKKQVIIREVHIALTTKCSLNCKHCNMFIPYQKNYGEHQPFEKITSSIDLFFKIVDKVHNLTLIGGEPFLYPFLTEVINYVYTNYNDKIYHIQIITNGTIIPKIDVINLLKDKKISISISDYTATVGYENKLQSFEKLLIDNNINYQLKSSLQWLDFRFPHKPLNIPDSNVFKHMHECMPVFKGLNDNKFYYCHIVWSAEKAGLLENNGNDYIDLTALSSSDENDKLKIIHHNLGYTGGQFISLCKKCAGCARSNTKIVKAAVQEDKGFGN